MIKEALATLRDQEKQKDANDIAYQVKHAQDRINLLLKEVDVLKAIVAEGLSLDLDDKDAIQKYFRRLPTNVNTSSSLTIHAGGRVGL